MFYDSWCDVLDDIEYDCDWNSTQSHIQKLLSPITTASNAMKYCAEDIKMTTAAVNKCVTRSLFKVKKVIFNGPATIIYWDDGSKTVVKCQPGDVFDPEKGFVMAYLKKLLGNDNTFNKEIAKWVNF